jgi:single-stranded-DNA-specific exonuclease
MQPDVQQPTQSESDNPCRAAVESSIDSLSQPSTGNGKEQQDVITTQALPEVSELAALILESRRQRNSLTTQGSLSDYINPSLGNYLQALHLDGLSEAMQHLLHLRESGERCAIISDYDVDGATSAAQLALLCESLGIRYFLQPTDRFRGGYGLTESRVKQAVEAGASTIIAVDIGTRDHEALAVARHSGVTSIVIDHHELSKSNALGEAGDVTRPDCDVFISPHYGASGFEVDAVCASALVFCVIAKLQKECEQSYDPTLQALSAKLPLSHCHALATLGTIADVMPLQGFNRALVKEGLVELSYSKSTGLNALKDAAGIQGLVSAQAVAFQLGPRINAMGRIIEDTAPGILKAIGLLVSDDENVAKDLAGNLSHANANRKAIERVGVVAAVKEIDEQLQQGGQIPPVLVIKENAIHPGVAGIIAARLVERYSRPVVVIGAEDSSSICRGSGRSAAGVNLIELLEACKDSLLQVGGHAAAAGFSLKVADVPQFRAQLNKEMINRYGDSVLVAKEADIEVSLQQLLATKNLESDLSLFEPCGQANPKPSFMLRDVTVVAYRVLLGGHAELLIRQGGAFGTTLLWNRSGVQQLPKVGDKVSMIVECHPKDFLRRFDVRARGNVFGVKHLCSVPSCEMSPRSTIEKGDG